MQISQDREEQWKTKNSIKKQQQINTGAKLVLWRHQDTIFSLSPPSPGSSDCRIISHRRVYCIIWTANIARVCFKQTLAGPWRGIAIAAAGRKKTRSRVLLRFSVCACMYSYVAARPAIKTLPLALSKLNKTVIGEHISFKKQFSRWAEREEFPLYENNVDNKRVYCIKQMPSSWREKKNGSRANFV